MMRTRRPALALVGLAAALALLLLTVQARRSLAEPPAAQRPNAERTARQFEYRVCTVQHNRVTFVNGVWIGTVQPRDGNTDVAIRSAPQVHEFLQAAGAEGWELVTGFSQRAGVNPNVADDITQTLFLKKER
jgi:hypothetical protein